MTDEKTSPLRQRMFAVSNILQLFWVVPQTRQQLTADDLRAYQLDMTQKNISAATFNSRIVVLRFFFGVTCDREEMKRYTQFKRKPHRQPIVLSVEEVSELLAAVPGPGLKFRAALGISYGAGLWASEVCNLRLVDLDSDRMLINVEHGKRGKDRKAMLSPALLNLLRDYWREVRPEGWLFPLSAMQAAIAVQWLNAGNR